MAGLGYNPQTRHYDASRNVRITSIELAPNFKVLLDSWNMNTNVWLRECIYKRVAKTGKKPGQVFLFPLSLLLSLLCLDETSLFVFVRPGFRSPGSRVLKLLSSLRLCKSTCSFSLSPLYIRRFVLMPSSVLFQKTDGTVSTLATS